MSRAVLFASSILLITISTDAASQFPRGCEVVGYGYNQNALVMNDTGTQSYYLIQNRSDKSIQLERRDSPDAFMSPKLETKLDPSRWAAFASDEKEMPFVCYTVVNDEKISLNCNDVLDVCQYPRVKFALSNMGNYWISTNKEQGQVIRDSVTKGILLRW